MYAREKGDQYEKVTHMGGMYEIEIQIHHKVHSGRNESKYRQNQPGGKGQVAQNDVMKERVLTSHNFDPNSSGEGVSADRPEGDIHLFVTSVQWGVVIQRRHAIAPNVSGVFTLDLYL